MIIYRVTNGLNTKASHGEWPGGAPPFVYDRHEFAPKKHTLVPNASATVVQMIFHLYVDEALGAVAIRYRLNERGLACTDRAGVQKPWTGEGVLNVLRNPAYIGKIRRNEDVYEGLHEPIISKKPFQARRSNWQSAGRSGNEPVTDSPYLLSGLIKCAVCGSAFFGRSRQGPGGQSVSLLPLPSSKQSGAEPRAITTLCRHRS